MGDRTVDRVIDRDAQRQFGHESAAAVLRLACAGVGLSAENAELLRLGENAIYRLAGVPVVVRIGRIARHLATSSMATRHTRPVTEDAVPKGDESTSSRRAENRSSKKVNPKQQSALQLNILGASGQVDQEPGQAAADGDDLSGQSGTERFSRLRQRMDSQKIEMASLVVAIVAAAFAITGPLPDWFNEESTPRAVLQQPAIDPIESLPPSSSSSVAAGIPNREVAPVTHVDVQANETLPLMGDVTFDTPPHWWIRAVGLNGSQCDLRIAYPGGGHRAFHGEDVTIIGKTAGLHHLQVPTSCLVEVRA